jgi:putative transcription factor
MKIFLKFNRNNNKITFNLKKNRTEQNLTIKNRKNFIIHFISTSQFPIEKIMIISNNLEGEHMICELCGQDVPFLKLSLVEGSPLKVCSNCARFGKAAAARSGSNDPDSGSSPGSGSGSSSGGGYGYGYTPDTPTKEEVIQKRLEMRQRRKQTKDIYEQRGEKELAIDFHKRIQQARNEHGWSQEELGQKINERKSVISKIENKSMKPDDKLVRKLEKALGIKLMEVLE